MFAQLHDDMVTQEVALLKEIVAEGMTFWSPGHIQLPDHLPLWIFTILF